MSRRSLRVGGLLAAALTVVVMVGCAGPEAAGPPTLSAAQAEQEYRTEAQQLQPAPKYTWPQQPIAAAAEDGVPMVYEPGFGRQAADSYWFCTWSARALEVDLTEADRQAAITTLDSIRTTYFYTKALAAESRPILDKVLDSAKLGDLAPLRNDHELNCPGLDGA